MEWPQLIGAKDHKIILLPDEDPDFGVRPYQQGKLHNLKIHYSTNNPRFYFCPPHSIML